MNGSSRPLLPPAPAPAWALAAALFAAACVTRSAATTPASSPGAEAADRFAAFAPRPDGRSEAIDYAGVDDLLHRIVLAIGPSLRQRAAPPPPLTGSRFTPGHDSPVRLEGNKVMFSRLDDEHAEAIHHYAEELTRLGQELEIAALPRTEQLAYWFNLHNLLVISEIMKRYPVREPRRIQIGPEEAPFHSAPLVELQGVRLSLRDIRVHIVYRYWRDPRVLYGFFHGDLASPNIRPRAWRPESVWQDLDSNAQEFVNALRGVARRRDATRVSPMYAEARPALFPEWPADLRRHLAVFADEPVSTILAETSRVEIGRYEGRIADLVGGRPFGGASPMTVVGGGWAPGTPPGLVQMMMELGRKFEQLERRGFGGRVTITDLPDADEGVDEDGDDEDADTDAK